MNRVEKAHCGPRGSRMERSGRVDRAARRDAGASRGRPGGREGEESMEIKIIINEAGTSRGMRQANEHGEGGRRTRRGAWRGRRHAGHHPGERHEGMARRERPAERGRVIGQVVELPDGRVKIISREDMETGRGPRRHWGEPRHEDRPSRHEGPGRWERRDQSDEDRETRRARRRLAREIVRALEAGGYNKA